MTHLQHITDVGISHGDGVDSTLRIKDQYRRLGEGADVVSAGHSPLHVAFAVCTTVSKQGRQNTAKVAHLLGVSPQTLPIAVNCAPRNSDTEKPNGQEDHIHRIQFIGEQTFLLYGPELLQWILVLAHIRDETWTEVEKIISLPDIIPDTSNGSQFRSAEHLPLAHVLQKHNKLDENSERENVPLEQIPDPFPEGEADTVVLPPDEYGNGRLLVHKTTFDRVLSQKGREISFPQIINGDQGIIVSGSLTEVKPGRISVWPSSNYFPNDNLRVLNIGTRWEKGRTRTTNKEVIDLAQRLSPDVGASYTIEI